MSDSLVPATAATSAVTDRGAAGFTLPQVIRRRGAGGGGQVFWSSSQGGSRTSGRGAAYGRRWGSFSCGASREASASTPVSPLHRPRRASSSDCIDLGTLAGLRKPGASQRHAEELHAPRRFVGGRGGRDRLVAELRKARVTGIRVTLPVETLDAKLASLPEGVSVSRDRIEVRFNGAKEAVGRLYSAGPRARERLRAVRGARRRGRGGRQGRGVRMSEALVPAAAEPAVVADGEADVGPAGADRQRGTGCRRAVSGVLRGADREPSGRGRRTGGRWGSISRGARREASASRRSRRSTWPPTSGPHPGSVPTVKQHLAAIRVLCDWLVVSQVHPVNPAAAVRGPKHVVTKGATPVPDPRRGEEAPRVHRHGYAGRPPRPGALLGDAL